MEVSTSAFQVFLNEKTSTNDLIFDTKEFSSQGTSSAGIERLNGVWKNDAVSQDDKAFLPELSDDEDDEAGTSSDGESSSEDGSSCFSSISGEISEVLSFTSGREGTSGEVLVDPASKEDNHLLCDVCREWIEGSCLEHITFVENNEEAVSELPEGFSLGSSTWKEGGTGVFAQTFVPKGQMMGPIKCPVKEDFVAKSISEIEYLWEVKQYNGKSWYLLNQDLEMCNWLACVGFTNKRAAQNVIALQFNGDVYYKALRDIEPGVELLCYRGEGLAWTKSIPKDTLIAPEPPKNSVDYGVYSCSHCPAEFRRIEQVSLHTKSDRHNPADDVCCRRCPFVGKARSDLRRHVYLKHDEKPFRCPFCPNSYKSSGHQQGHIAKVHSSGKPRKTHKCQFCGKAFRILQHKMNHEATHKPKQHECSNCGLKLASEWNLREHIEARHSDMKHACPHCGKEHNSKQTMKVHVKKYHTLGGQRERAERLARTERQKEERKKLTAEQREQNRVCRFCGLVLASSSARLRHEKRKHPVEVEMVQSAKDNQPPGQSISDLTCKKCGKVMSAKIEMVYHMKRHEGNLPFKCSNCDKAYITASELRKHIKRSVTCGAKEIQS